jgi:arsenical pump membrane protein
MILAQIVVVACNCWLTLKLFKNSIPEKYDDDLPEAGTAVKDSIFFKSAIFVLALVLVGYFVASQAHIPPYVVASIGCVILFIMGSARKHLDLPKLGKSISWSLFPFVIGLFVVMQGIENLGLAKHLASGLKLIGNNTFYQILVNAAAAALGSNLINNIPMSLLSISVLKQLNLPGLASQFGALLGCNLGPNITVTGSLATMLVISAARKRGSEISAADFFKAGIIVTPILLLIGVCCVWATYEVFNSLHLFQELAK